jgi:nucleotide-binding universal stress UspA family protein
LPRDGALAAVKEGRPMPGHVLMVAETSPTPTSPGVVQGLVSVADQLGEAVTAVIFRRRIRTSAVGGILEGLGGRARALQRTYEAEAEQLAEACASAAAQAGLDFRLAEIDPDDDPLAALASLARTHDACVLPLGPTAHDELDRLAAVLHRAGRPVVLIPDLSPVSPSARWRQAVIAWTPSAQVARAMKEAAPLLRKAEAVSVLVVQEKVEEFSVEGAIEALRYLQTRGVEAHIRSVPADGQAVGLRIAQFMDENSADLLVMGAPSKPLEADFTVHSKAIDVLEHARWVILVSG